MSVSSREAWVRNFFRIVDTINPDEIVAHVTEDVRLQFANQKPIVGREAIRQALAETYSSIQRDVHNIIEIWQKEDSVAVEIEVVYTRLDGKQVTTPTVTILRLEGNLIKDYRIFQDNSPVYAADPLS